jgi:diguanylate cyclase (GGDEF)-like protein
MFLTMLIIAIIFVAVVFYLAKVIVLQQEQKADEDAMRAKNVYQDFIEQKNRAIEEKSRLEKEAAQIFTLYEMTKDITKNFNEVEAFKVFLKKLKENIRYDDCRILDVSLEKLREIRSAKDYDIFPLKSKERTLGYLIYKGIPDGDKEKFVILAHQFALALRRIRLYQDIERMAITDSLTEVHTRRYFVERFEEEIARAALRKTPLSILMLDVDHFKHFNDQYGHMTGDRILKTMGQILKDNIREIDIAGRFGGEEFCIVLPETDLEGAILAGERIRKATESTDIQAYDHKVKISLSGGVAIFPEDGQTVDDLIDKADWALYRAKTLGRNKIVAFRKSREKS